MVKSINRRDAIKGIGIAGLGSLFGITRKARADIQEITEINPNRNNPFIQPIETTRYYGSGNPTLSGLISGNDYDLIRRMTNSEIAPNDYADINGDGIIDSKDLILLDGFLTGKIPYLPGQWNKLQTSQEKTEWIKKMNIIDKADEHRYIDEKYECDSFANQVYMNFSGYENNDIPLKFDRQNIGRFNIPVYHIRTRTNGHSINAALTGENPLNFNDWFFFDDTQFDSYPTLNDKWTFPADSKVNMYIIYRFNSDTSGSYIEQLRFNIDSNRNVEWEKHNPNLILEKKDVSTLVSESTQNPKGFSLSQNYPNPFNSETNIEYSLEKPERVCLEIFNSTGQKLETLANGFQQQGTHIINIDLKGKASGNYFCKLRVGQSEETRKMILRK